MQRSFLYKVLFATAAVTATVMLAVFVIQNEPHYNARSATEWFNWHNSQEKNAAFRTMGTKAFPYLIEKLNGSVPDRIRACVVVGDSFDRSQIENSPIKGRLERILDSGQQGEQMAAYNAVRKLGLNIPDSVLSTAARTCPSIRADLEDTIRKPKLARLATMTNSPDCTFIADLCKDPDPYVQMAALGHLIRLERAKNNETLCAKQIVPALASLMTNKTDPSVLRLALAYMSDTPQKMRENLTTVCGLLEKTTNSGVQSECLALIGSLARHESLPAQAQRSLESFASRKELEPDIRGQANALSHAQRSVHSN